MLSKDILEILDQTTTCAVSDVLVKMGTRSYMGSRIRALNNHRLAGYALTMERRDLEMNPSKNAIPGRVFVEMIETAEPSTVFVISSIARMEVALWGGLVAAAASKRGAGGVVCDGPVRDPLEINDVQLPCFATGAIPSGPAGIQNLAAVNEPVWCGGVLVRPGDFVFGDSNGVVVIPAGKEREVLEESVKVERGDQEAMKRILAGAGLIDTMNALGRF
ncbi:RraA family protein [Shumkonia mesophila]|uniref:RraA family protein n=1 Tax=Shumkonia mesophila TaxID=2838854 RepID=UPI002934130D|nr:RraA family protein [Shumkonia mesophila]